MSAPLAIVNFKATSDPVATIRYFSNPQKVVAMYDGLSTGVAVGSAKELTELLLANHHDKRAKRVCRTAVLSVKTPRNATKEQLDDIDRRLLQAAADLQKVLKVASMLGWIHGNSATRHLHILFPNSSGRRTLDLRPKFLRQLQGFAWTASLLSGRGKGRRKALPVYSKSKKLAVRDLALILMDSEGNIRKDRWESMVKTGEISNFRRRKDGELISFEWGKKRVRVATLKGFAIENTQPENQKHHEIIPEYRASDCDSQQLLGPCQQPSAGSVTPAVTPATGQREPSALPVALATKSTSPTAIGIVADAIQDCRDIIDDVASTRTRGPDPVCPEPFQIGDVALQRKRFRRRSVKRHATPEVGPVSGPAPKFKRVTRPGFGF